MASMQWLCGHYDLKQSQTKSSVAIIDKLEQQTWIKPKSTTGPRSRRAWKPMAIRKVGFTYVLAPLLMASQTLCRMFRNWSRRQLLDPGESWSHCVLLGFSDKLYWRCRRLSMFFVLSNPWDAGIMHQSMFLDKCLLFTAKSLIQQYEIFAVSWTSLVCCLGEVNPSPWLGPFVVALLRIESTDQCGVDNWSHVRQKDSRARPIPGVFEFYVFGCGVGFTVTTHQKDSPRFLHL